MVDSSQGDRTKLSQSLSERLLLMVPSGKFSECWVRLPEDGGTGSTNVRGDIRRRPGIVHRRSDRAEGRCVSLLRLVDGFAADHRLQDLCPQDLFQGGCGQVAVEDYEIRQHARHQLAFFLLLELCER